MADILYAARGGNAASDLYTLNPATGAETAIGSIGYAVTGMAFDPVTSTLYGVTSQQSPVTTKALITINVSTGVGTLVAVMAKGMGDIAFDRTGQLWGDNTITVGRGLYSIDKATAAITQITSSLPAGNFGGAMDFMRTAPHTLYACDLGEEDSVYTYLTVAPGTRTFVVALSGAVYPTVGASVAGGSFSPGGVFYAIVSNYGAGTHLVTINMSTGVITDIAALAFNNFDAIAWYPPVAYTQTVWCIDAITDPGSSGTLTVLGDAVKELQTTGAPYVGEPVATGDATPAFYVRNANLPPPGKYTVTCKFRRSGGLNETWKIWLRRNGVVVAPVSELLTSATAVTRSLLPQYNITLPPGKTQTIGIAANDVIEVCAMITCDTPPPSGIELMQVCFTVVEAGGGAASPMYLLDMDEPQVPLGGNSYDPFFIEPTVVNHANSQDITVMPNGDIYVFYVHQSTISSSGPYYVKLSKWNGSSWSIVNNNVWGLGAPGPSNVPAWNASIVNDGTHLYMACGIKSTNTMGDWQWHCWKYVIATNTTTELGTGQSYYAGIPKSTASNAGYLQAASWDNGRVTLEIAPNGVLWAAWSEKNPSPNNFKSNFVGSAVNLDSGTEGFYSIDGANPAARNGSGKAVGTIAGESGSYFTPLLGEEVYIPLTFAAYEFSDAVLTIGALPTGSDWIGYEYRLSGQGTSTRNGYRFIVKSVPPGHHILWQKLVSGVATTLATYTGFGGAGNLAIGDKFQFYPSSTTPNVYWWDASVGSSWGWLGSSWGSDSTYTSSTDKSAITFSGTSGSWDELYAGSTTKIRRPCVFYWDGAAWQDTGLEAIAGGVVRNTTGGQWIGVVSQSDNEAYVQMTFCHHDGPSNYPAITYWNEHNYPGAAGFTDPLEELRLAYYEYNGTTWGNYLKMDTWTMFGDALYETGNTAPYYTKYNGYDDGYCLFNDGQVPWIATNILMDISSADLMSCAKMASDGSGFFGEAAGHPDDVLRDYSDSSGGGHFAEMGLHVVVDSRGQFIIWCGAPLFPNFGNILMRHPTGLDLGTGSQWGYASKKNNSLPAWLGQRWDAMTIDSDDNVIVLTNTDDILNTSLVYKYTQSNLPWYPWRLTLTGVVGMAWKQGD